MKKGFTLVELLAVIVILAIILAIAIPGISNIIEASKRGAAESDAKMLLKAVELKIEADATFDPVTLTEDNVKEVLEIDNSNYERLTVKKMNGQLYIIMVGKNKWEGITISGTKKNIRIDETIVTTLTPGEVANPPVLAPGMIPIKWVTDHWVTTNEDDPDWYQYGTTSGTRNWANAITKDCEIVNDVPTNIETCSMWVWIPRYIYRIRPKEGDANSGWHKSTAGIIDIQFSKGIDDNWNNDEIGFIDLREGAEASNAVENDNKYTNHPAFTFGEAELTGFWAAKFEASSNTPNALYGGGDNTTLKVKLVPNVPSWRDINVVNMFIVSKNMETSEKYGWGNTGKGIDTHLINNVEWGAIAYLSHSTYGKNSEIYINPSNTYITGRNGQSVSQSSTDDISGEASNTLYGYDGRLCSSKEGNICTGAVNTTYGMAASTTGNIYGVYDMSGAAWEYSAAYANSGHTSLTNYGNNIVNADDKYKDVYKVSSIDTASSNYTLTASSKGDALFETSGAGTGNNAWNGDCSCMPYNDNPWFFRGGRQVNQSTTGLFCYSCFTGRAYREFGFRPVLLVRSGL